MGPVIQPAEINGEPHIWVAVGFLRTYICCCSRTAKCVACGSESRFQASCFKSGMYLTAFLDDSQIKQGFSLSKIKQD